MQQISFELIEKTRLTHDVYELKFKTPETISIEPGHYTLFSLPISKLRRAYSIGYSDGRIFTYIIKQVENGIGSAEICSLKIGETIMGMVPLGHFILRKNNIPKLFIGTGTGFAPLHFQIRGMMDSIIETPLLFIFGIRTKADIFYIEKLSQMKEQYPMFDYQIYLSQEKIKGTIF